jgi:hypothetical protein
MSVHYLSLTPQDFADMIDAHLAAGKNNGGIYYEGPDDFNNSFSYYTDGSRAVLGSYFNASGQVNAVPTGATGVTTVYTISGTVQNQVTGAQTNLWQMSFHVVTALADDDFECLYSFNGSQTRSLKAGQQLVRWYIPGSLIPLRTVVPKLDGNDKVVGIEIKEEAPVQCMYSVRLRQGLKTEDISEDYLNKNAGYSLSAGIDGIYFYTNDWREADNATKYFFPPNNFNQFYFYTTDFDEDNDGRIPLYVLSNLGVGVLPPTGLPVDVVDVTTPGLIATVASAHVPGQAYYVLHKNVIDEQNPDKLRDVFVPVSGNIVSGTAAGEIPHIAVNSLREPNLFQRLDKNINPTETEDFVKTRQGFWGDVSGTATYIVDHSLGNNGRLMVPLHVSNTPTPSPTSPIPKMGDDSDIMLWACMMLVSGLVILLVLLWRKWQQIKGKW